MPISSRKEGTTLRLFFNIFHNIKKQETGGPMMKATSCIVALYAFARSMDLLGWADSCFPSGRVVTLAGSYIKTQKFYLINSSDARFFITLSSSVEELSSLSDGLDLWNPVLPEGWSPFSGDPMLNLYSQSGPSWMIPSSV